MLKRTHRSTDDLRDGLLSMEGLAQGHAPAVAEPGLDTELS